MERIQYDYKEIACCYNTASATDMYRFIREKYGVYNPYDVIKRMKKSGSYLYDRDSDQCLLKLPKFLLLIETPEIFI